MQTAPPICIRTSDGTIRVYGNITTSTTHYYPNQIRILGCFTFTYGNKKANKRSEGHVHRQPPWDQNGQRARTKGSMSRPSKTSRDSTSHFWKDTSFYQ